MLYLSSAATAPREMQVCVSPIRKVFGALQVNFSQINKKLDETFFYI